MKLRVHVLAWPLTLSVALSQEEQIAAESAVKDALLKEDKEKYKDAVVLLDLKEKVFLDGNDQSEVKPSIRQKKHVRRHQTSAQEDLHTVDKTNFLPGDETIDLGNLKLYQVGGHLDGLENDSAVSSNEDEEEKIYVMIDRQDFTTTTRREKASVKMEGDIHLGAKHVTKESKPQDIGILERKGVKIRERMRRRLGKNRDVDSKKRHFPPSNDKDRRYSRQLFLNGNRGEATGNSLHDNKVLLNGCVQGTSSFVTEQCRFFNCCQGDDACEWPDDQIATVCPNSCNGYKACYYIGAGTYIGRDSCNSGYAYDYDKSCAYFASFSRKASSRIGQNSCNGAYACWRICYSSNDCQATIENNACNGELYPCLSIGEPIEDFNLQIESVFVGDGSCTNLDPADSRSPCGYSGAYARSINIGEESCIGPTSCKRLGYNTRIRVRVGDMSCTDFRSCEDLGFMAGRDGYKSKVTVGDGSCSGAGACLRLGSNSYRNVQVGDNACTNYLSCQEFAIEIENDNVRVRSDQCRRPMECSGVANADCLGTATVPNGGGSCPGPYP